MRNLLYILIFLLLPALAKAQPGVSITAASDTICHGMPAYFTATDSGVSTAYYKWKVNGIIAGSDNAIFIPDSLTNGAIVFCLLTDSTGDSVLATSDTITMTVLNLSLPSAGIITGPGTVCQYATMILTDSIAGGVWGASNTYAADTNGVITGVSVIPGFETYPSPATDTITYIVSNTCGSDTAFKSIIIEPLPNANFFIDACTYPYTIYSYCVGMGACINEGNGINGYIYATNGNASVGAYGVGFMHVGGDTLICVDSNYCGVDTYAVAIDIISTPAITPIIASSTVICGDSSITLTDSSASVYASIWYISNNNAYLTYVNTYMDILTGAKIGLDTITIGVWNECGIVYAAISITVAPPYPIENAGAICSSMSYTLIDSSIDGLWSSTNTAIASIDTYIGLLTAISPGIDTITYTLPNGCYATASLTVNPLPGIISVPSVLLCADSAISISDTGANGIWSVNNTNVAAIDPYQVDQLNAISPGYATLYYTIPNGCYDSTILTVVNCNASEVIFPNPSTDEVTIQVNTAIYSSYTFTDMLGQVLLRQPINNSFTTIDIASLPPGIYFITLYGANNKYVSKFLKI